MKLARRRLNGILVALAVVVAGVVIGIGVVLLRPPDPLDNVLNEDLVLLLTRVGEEHANDKPCFRIGFEKARWSSGQTTVSSVSHPNGFRTLTMVTNHGSNVEVEKDPADNTLSVKGILKLGDGRVIRLSRVHHYDNVSATTTIHDTSTITDFWGRELRNSLTETQSIDGSSRVVGVMTSSSTGEHRINRTYAFVENPHRGWEDPHRVWVCRDE